VCQIRIYLLPWGLYRVTTRLWYASGPYWHTLGALTLELKSSGKYSRNTHDIVPLRALGIPLPCNNLLLQNALKKTVIEQFFHCVLVLYVWFFINQQPYTWCVLIHCLLKFRRKKSSRCPWSLLFYVSSNMQEQHEWMVVKCNPSFVDIHCHSVAH